MGADAMRTVTPPPNDRFHIGERSDAANAYRYPAEVPTKTDSPGFRAGVAGKGGSSVGSDQAAIEVTLPVTDRVITFDPPGRAVSPSRSTALSLSAQNVPSELPMQPTQ